MTEKELLHKQERKAIRRRERNRVPKSATKSEKRRIRAKIEERNLEKELTRVKKLEFGIKQLGRLGEPLVEESQQREIERNIVEND